MALIKHGNNALSSVTAFPSAVPTGKPVLLSTATASSSASIEFTLNSSYDISYFEFINIHPSTDSVYFNFQTSTDNGSTYATTITSTYFMAYHSEGGAGAVLTYDDTLDQAQGTSNQTLLYNLGNDADQNANGYIHLFNPSSTTFVKHYISDCNWNHYQDYSFTGKSAGYFNTTLALTNIKFIFSSGNIDAGTIKMYGISA